MRQGKRLELTRDQILGHRRRVSALDTRMPPGAASLEKAASAGLQDSMPRAALLSLHARVEGSAESIEHVEVGGSAVIVARGEFRL